MQRSFLLATFASLLPAQAVLQVGPGGYPDIAQAVAAAQPGDVIEVALPLPTSPPVGGLVC